MKLQIFDSTLRDGAQGANVSFSVDDKIKVIQTLDRLGIDFIEAGNPFSNPAEMQFFQRIAGLRLAHAKIVAFGSTRRKNTAPRWGGGFCIFRCPTRTRSNPQALADFGRARRHTSNRSRLRVFGYPLRRYGFPWEQFQFLARQQRQMGIPGSQRRCHPSV